MIRLLVKYVREELDVLYRSYLTNDAQGAKKDLTASVELLMPLTNSALIDVSEGLWLVYARLYCIENEIGDTNRAAKSFEDARHWYAISKRHRVANEGLAPEKMREAVAGFTEEKCKRDVIEWDEAFTKGKGAPYMQN